MTFRDFAITAWYKARRAAYAAYRAGSMSYAEYSAKEDRLQRAWDKRWYSTR